MFAFYLFCSIDPVTSMIFSFHIICTQLRYYLLLLMCTFDGTYSPIRTTEPTDTTSIIVYVCMFTLQIMMGPTGPIRTTEPTDTTSIIIYVCMIKLQIVRGPTGFIRTTEPLFFFYIVDCEGSYRSYRTYGYSYYYYTSSGTSTV